MKALELQIFVISVILPYAYESESKPPQRTPKSTLKRSSSPQSYQGFSRTPGFFQRASAVNPLRWNLLCSQHEISHGTCGSLRVHDRRSGGTPGRDFALASRCSLRGFDMFWPWRQLFWLTLGWRRKMERSAQISSHPNSQTPKRSLKEHQFIFTRIVSRIPRPSKRYFLEAFECITKKDPNRRVLVYVDYRYFAPFFVLFPKLLTFFIFFYDLPTNTNTSRPPFSAQQASLGWWSWLWRWPRWSSSQTSPWMTTA